MIEDFDKLKHDFTTDYLYYLQNKTLTEIAEMLAIADIEYLIESRELEKLKKENKRLKRSINK